MSKAAELAALIGSQTALSNRNLIINGAMQVAQRGTSFSYAHDGTAAAYNLDRFKFTIRTNADEYDCTIAQVSDAPAGFSNSLKLTTGTAESAVGSDEYYVLFQGIEAQNLQHLQHGTSNAKSITVSFYVKSSITGTFGFSIYKPDNTARVIAKTYTINSANTWERKTITIEGDTGQSIDNDNNGGMYVYWLIGAGTDFNSGASTTAWADYGSGTTWFQASATNNVVTTAGATFQLTGVQLEVGDVATPFEHRSFDDELDRCKRYYQKSFAYGTAPANDIAGVRMSEMPSSDSASYAGALVYLEKTMRATPTVVAYNPQAAPANSGAYINDLVNGTVTTEYQIASIVAYSSQLRFFLTTAPTTGGNPYGCNWTAEVEL
jgi:predicted secreted protein